MLRKPTFTKRVVSGRGSMMTICGIIFGCVRDPKGRTRSLMAPVLPKREPWCVCGDAIFRVGPTGRRSLLRDDGAPTSGVLALDFWERQEAPVPRWVAPGTGTARLFSPALGPSLLSAQIPIFPSRARAFAERQWPGGVKTIYQTILYPFREMCQLDLERGRGRVSRQNN